MSDASLLDDGVGVRAQADAHEEILNVAQPRDAAIDEVFALSGTIQPAADDNFAGFQMHRRPFSGGFFLQEFRFAVNARGSVVRFRDVAAAFLFRSLCILRALCVKSFFCHRAERAVRNSDRPGCGSFVRAAIEDKLSRLDHFGIDQRQRYL